MKATDLLKDQHQEVRQLFAKLERTDDGSEREELRELLAEMLVAHSAIEKEIFYPAIEPSDLVAESFEEHAVVEWCLQRLLATDAEDEEFHPRVVVLKEILFHHLDEEEDVLLPRAERSLDDARLEELGARMERRVEEIQRKGYEGVLAASLGVIARSLRERHPRAARASVRKRAGGAKRAAAKSAPARTAKRAAPKRATKRAPQKRATQRSTAARTPKRTTKRRSGATTGARKQGGAKRSTRGRKSRASR